MNSFFILFSVIRLIISNLFVSNFLPEEIGVGNYRVTEFTPAIGANSYIMSILDVDTNKTLKFKVVSDDADYIKITVKSMSPSDTSKRILNLMVGVEFSVIRTEKKQGHQLAYAKWLS